MKKSLENVKTAMKSINGKVFHYDDFADGKLGVFGKSLILDGITFERTQFAESMFEEDTIISKAFDNKFSGFTFCIYECNEKYYPNENDLEPSITTIETDDRIYIIGYCEGSEV